MYIKGKTTILAIDIYKLEKNCLKVGKIWILCSDFDKFWKSTRTHQYSHENLIGMFYGVHRHSRKKNSVRWSMVRFRPCSLCSGLLALIFSSKTNFYMLCYSVVASNMILIAILLIDEEKENDPLQLLISPFIKEYSPMCTFSHFDLTTFFQIDFWKGCQGPMKIDNIWLDCKFLEF